MRLVFLHNSIKAMKKTLLSILFLTLATVQALAAVYDTFTVDGITYKVTSEEPKTVQVTGFDEMAADLILPSEVNGYTVTLIGQGAFHSCTALTSVKIPDSVTKLDWMAFMMCTNLASVEIPGSVTVIFRDAFYGCSSLTSIVIPNSVTTIGQQAFYGCNYLTEVTIADGDSPLSFDVNVFKNAPIETLYLGRDFSGAPFKGQESLKNLTISNSVTALPDNAFEQCESLTSIEIPASVTSLGTYVFSDCIGLTSITCLATTPPAASAPTFNSFNKSECTLNVPTGCASVYKIAPYWDGFKAYKEPALQLGDEFTADGIVYKVTSVDLNTVMVKGFTDEVADDLTLPEEVNGYSITLIDSNAFKDCENLHSIVIPVSVLKIGDNVFYNCSNLTSVQLPQNLKSIGAKAFYKCTLLESIVLPNSVNRIGDSAFFKCQILTNVELPSALTEISIGLFANCTGLTSIVIPASVSSIKDNAFINCTSLKSMTCLATVPPTASEQAFDGFDKSACTLTVPEGSESAYKADEKWDGFKFDNTTSIESIGADSINLTVNGTEVTVTGTDECVRVYDLSGRAILTTSERTFSLPSGVAIIVIADHTFRLAI